MHEFDKNENEVMYAWIFATCETSNDPFKNEWKTYFYMGQN
jgi:hypothetical protein